MALGLFRQKTRGVERTPAEVVRFLADFLNATGHKWDWDDFLSTPITDAELEKIRQHCRKLDLEFPPDTPGEFCNAKGLDLIRGYLEQLRPPAGPAAAR